MGIAAVIAGSKSFAAIGQWAGDAGPDVLAGLGAMRGAAEESTFRRAFALLDPENMRETIRELGDIVLDQQEEIVATIVDRAQALSRLVAEDPTLRLENNAETRQLVLWCMGEAHADLLLDRLGTRYGVGVETKQLRVPLRETVGGKARGLGRNVKQTGGHVTVVSEPGRGTTFKIYLPVATAASEPPAAAV